MSTSTDPVRQRMAAANPAQPEVELPGDIMAAAVLLDVIDGRSGAMTHELDSQEQGPAGETPRLRRNWVTAFAAGFAVVLVVGISVALLNRGGGSLDAVAPAPTSETIRAATMMAIGDDGRSLVLMAYGDSLTSYPTADLGVIGAYAGMLEDEFRVSVEVQNRTVLGISATELLRSLASERARTDQIEADVILLAIPTSGWEESLQTVAGFGGRDPADCGGDDNQQCLRDSLSEYRSDVRAILSVLTANLDPSETLIRVLDVYQLHVDDQIASDTLQITNPYWRDAQEFLEETAAGYGIPVAQVYDEFMGPDGSDNPQDRGLVKADQLHPTEAGKLLMAEMLHGLGYGLGRWGEFSG